MAAILGSMLVFVDATVVNAALPAIAADLDAGLASQQWVVEAYMLTLAALMLVGGSAGDIYGRRRVYALGLTAFGVTSLLCAIAPNVETLIVARGLQGIAGALLVPSTLAIITSTFHESERGKAIGSWTAWTGIGAVIGPLGGGLLIDLASWRLIFAINLPLVAATLWLLLRHVRESVDLDAEHHPDIVGALLCTVGLAGPVFALIEQPRYGFSHPLIWIPLVGGLATFVGFLAFEHRARHPMLSLDLFRNRNFTITNIACFSLYAGLGAALFFVIIFVQQVSGYSALKAGLSLLPITLLMFTLSRRFGALADRIGARPLMSIGPLVAGLGLLALVRLDRDVSYLTELLPAIAIFGLGLAITVAPLTATVLGAVEDREAGLASGINNAVSRVAGLVAIAALGAVVSAAFSSRLEAGLAGVERSPAVAAAVEEAKRRPLAGSRSSPAVQAVPELGAAVDEAAVTGFRTGMVVAALLVMGGGLISAIGIRDCKRPKQEVVPAQFAASCSPQPQPAAHYHDGATRAPGGVPAEAPA